jgi:membrane-bound lytic murein transglycosylase D
MMLKAIVKSRATPWLLLAATLAAAVVFVLRASGRKESLPPELQELSAAIQARGRDYGKGLELIVSGDPVMGRNLLASATDRMTNVAEECMRMEGCDIELFIDALSTVFEQQRIVLNNGEKARRSAASPTPSVPEQLTDQSPAIAAFPEMSRSVSLLRGIDLRELITLNVPVKSALNDWLTWNRPRLAEAYEQYLFLRKETAPIYEKADLPEALLFGLMAQETGAKVHAYSSAGAAGPLQFMPRTGRRYGLIRVGGFDMRLDPVASTRASAQYLNDQLARLNNELEKALAAYNGGESRLARLHRKLAGASFWDPELYYAVPSETRNYVPGVVAAAWLFLHPGEYGLEFPDLEVGTTAIMLTEDVSIGELTVCLGQEQNRNGWFRTLRNLNPRLSGDERIGAGEKMRMPSLLVPKYVERCTGDSPLLARARELHDAAYEQEEELVEYRVKRGDTLASIAGRFGCRSLGKLARMNGIKGPNYRIRVGQRLTFPGCS